MKKYSLRRFYFILILPLITLIASFILRWACGPFWQYSDPCYIYLFNALPMIKGQPPFDTNHPGTPLQILIAVVLWIYNLGRPAAEIIDHALLNPELYLRIVYVILVLGSFWTSVVLGIYVYRKTKDKLAVLLTQLTGFTFLILPSFNNGSFPVIPVVANVSPEPLFISVLNLFTLFLLKLYFADDKSRQPGNVRILAFICGLGMAIKINFLFVLLSAFLLVPVRKKLLFLVLCVLSFLFCTAPIIVKYHQMFHWLGNMASHSSRYGTGSETFIDWSSFFLYLSYMVHAYWFFIYLSLGLWLWSSFCLIKNHQDRNSRFIWALAFCCLLHFAATAKHFSYHYLLPGLGLFSAIFVLFYLSQKDKFKIVKPLTAVFILIYIAVCVFSAWPYYQKLLNLSQDIRHFNDRVASDFPQCTVIASTTEDIDLFLNKKEALLRANGTILNTGTPDLSRLYPDTYYFFSEEVSNPDPNIESYGIWNFKQRVFADDIMPTSPCFIFTKYHSDFSNYPYQTRLVEHSQYLNAFLLTSSTEKEANALFAMALDAFKKGDFQQALAFGLKSRQLNFEPRGQIEYVLTIIYHDLLKSKGMK